MMDRQALEEHLIDDLRQIRNSLAAIEKHSSGQFTIQLEMRENQRIQIGQLRKSVETTATTLSWLGMTAVGLLGYLVYKLT